ncbi:MAG: GNAT family N-acetyltransferase [Pseudomonadota bacterium]
MDTSGNFDVRFAQSDELDAVADVWFESASGMDGAMSEMPSRGELRSRINQEIAGGWVLHVALRHGRVVGMLALRPSAATLDQLFVHPSDQGHGVGRALLNVAKSTMPDGFRLRTASSNARGRAFYERQGLSLLKEDIHPRTGAPVCFYEWSGR